MVEVDVPDHEVAEVTPEMLEQARQELRTAGYAYRTEGSYEVYDLGRGTTFALPVADENTANSPAPMLDGGFAHGTAYIDMTATDQRALVAAGAAASASAICAASGQAAPVVCPVAVGVAAAAVVYINEYGICKGTLRTKVRMEAPRFLVGCIRG
ncbi:hypothetical protein [Georgenia alba]|uniref:Uncharacterized protein n=1 Tax=Georgenia alba TaxID=2233858 RepID=A0ABW2Q3R7_9MICO